MLKILESTKSIIRPGEGRVGVGSDSKAESSSRCKFGDSKVGGSEVAEDEVGKKDQEMFKSKKLSKFKKTAGSLDFFTSKSKLTFTKLRQAFVKSLIFHNFDPERYICIETNVLGYAISGVLN